MVKAISLCVAQKRSVCVYVAQKRPLGHLSMFHFTMAFNASDSSRPVGGGWGGGGTVSPTSPLNLRGSVGLVSQDSRVHMASSQPICKHETTG